jgi:hypothetical protein
VYDVSLSWFQLQVFKGQIILFSWGFVFWNKMAWLWIFHENNLTKLHMNKICPKHFSIKASGRLIDWLVVFNIIFNTQWLYIWWLFDFILMIFVPAKFVYVTRSIDFHRQFRFFFSKRLLWCIVARILYGRVCQLLAVDRCFTPTTPPVTLTIIYIAIAC